MMTKQLDNTKWWALTAILLICGLSLPLAANAAGYVSDSKSKCQAWAPSMLDKEDYLLRYQGECGNGHAEGNGKAEWLYRYSENKVVYTWEGRFKNGIFIGDQPVVGNVDGIPNSDRFIVKMGKVASANLLFISTSGQTSPMQLCKVDELAVEVPTNTKIEDDNQISKLLKGAGDQYRATCPKGNNSTFRINAYPTPFALTKANYLPQALAEITFDPSKSGEEAYTFYNNKASEAVKNQKLQQTYKEKKLNNRKTFMDYSRKHKVESWVTSTNLEKNPFVWKDKTVALVVKLHRMLTPTLALVLGVEGGDYWDRGSYLLLNGVKADFFTDKDAVIVARVDQRKQSKELGDTSEYKIEATTLNFVDGQSCEKQQCAEWFSWDGSYEVINWNKPLLITN